jgi:hypothetical protein
VDPQAKPGTVPEIRLKSEGADSKAFSSMHYAMRNPISPYPDEELQIHQERVQGRGIFLRSGYGGYDCSMTGSPPQEKRG